jgi:hypothetical protein
MSLIEQAKSEMARNNFDEEDSRVMIEILEKFFGQWDSGGAVYAAAPVLQRLIAGKPLSPLTGADDEWVVHDFDDDCYAQNVRCSSVFKRRDGSAYDIASGLRVPVTFPYWPDKAEVLSPVIEVEVK